MTDPALDIALAELERRIWLAESIGASATVEARITLGALRALRDGLKRYDDRERETQAAIKRQAGAVRLLETSRTAQEECYRRIASSLAGVDREALLTLLASTREECRRWNARATELEEEGALARALAAPAADLASLRSDYLTGRQAGTHARLSQGERLVEEPDQVPDAPAGATAQWGAGWRRGWQEADTLCERDFYRAELARRFHQS